jgi:hypothetical protein
MPDHVLACTAVLFRCHITRSAFHASSVKREKLLFECWIDDDAVDKNMKGNECESKIQRKAAAFFSTQPLQIAKSMQL